MYTAEDIRNVVFTKSMGGYKMSEVDLFIDECADTVEELTRKNAEQAKKLEMLAERLMEYRKDEDNIHTALLSAQRAGDALLREAQHKADLILQDASIKAENIQESAQRDIHKEQEELQRIKDEVTSFKNRLLEMYRQHLTAIDALPEEKEEAVEPTAAESTAEAETTPAPMPAPASEPAEAPAFVPPTEGNVTDIFSSSQPLSASEAPVVSEDALRQEETAPEQTGFFQNTAENEPGKREPRFSDLQFGPDYEIDRESRHRLFGKRK